MNSDAASKPQPGQGTPVVTIVSRRRPKPKRFTKTITIYVSEARHEEISARAQVRCDTLSRYARGRITGVLARSLPRDLEAKVLGSILVALAELREVLAKARPGSAQAKGAQRVLMALTDARARLRQTKQGHAHEG